MNMYSYITKHLSEIGIGSLTFDNEDEKKLLINEQTTYDLCRSLKMFRYEGLPETIPERNLELYLQTNGYTCITEVEGKLYAFYGGLGGSPNEYYMPTICIVNNPYLKFNKQLEIDKDCIIIPNDSMYMGLLPLLNKYNSMLIENEFSMVMVDILSRITSIVASADDQTKASAELFFKHLRDGYYSVITNNAFLDSLKSLPMSGSSTNNALIPFIEYEQYLKVSKYNEIGLNGNYNMKRESINSNEAQLNDDFLKPFIDDMFESRQKAIEKINKKYGLNIKVFKNSAWEDIQEEEELEHDIMKVQSDAINIEETPDEPKEEPTGVDSEDTKEEASGDDSGEDSEELQEAIEEIEEIIEEIKEGDDADETIEA